MPLDIERGQMSGLLDVLKNQVPQLVDRGNPNEALNRIRESLATDNGFGIHYLKTWVDYIVSEEYEGSRFRGLIHYLKQEIPQLNEPRI